MLEPLGRCRRHSTLFQFASNGLRDFIDPSKGARSAASVQWPGVSGPGCPLNALSRSAPLAGPQDFRWRWTVPRMSAAAAFPPLSGPWVPPEFTQGAKSSDLSAGRYGRFRGGARPPPSPESFGHRGRGQLPSLPGAPAPVSGPGPDQGHNEHPERTPGRGACVRPVNAGLAAPVHLRLFPRPSRTAWLHPVAGLYDAATRRTPVWSTTATAFRPDLPPQCHAVSQAPRTSAVQRTRCGGWSFDARPDRGSAACPPASSEPAPAKAGGTVRRCSGDSQGPGDTPTERPAPFISRVSFTCPAFSKVRRPPPRRLRE